MAVGRIKERDVTPRAPTGSPFPVPLFDAFGKDVRPEDIELGVCEDVDRNYYLFSWLGESRGTCPQFKPHTYEQEVAVCLALQQLPIVDNISDSMRCIPDGDLFYIGHRHLRMLSIEDILSFDYDAVAYVYNSAVSGAYSHHPTGKTWRELFGQEGVNFIQQANDLRTEGWQFFIYGFSG